MRPQPEDRLAECWSPQTRGCLRPSWPGAVRWSSAGAALSGNPSATQCFTPGYKKELAEVGVA